MVPSGMRVPYLRPTLWLIITVWANQFGEVLGPVDRKHEVLLGVDLIEQLIGGISSVAPTRCVLEHQLAVGLCVQAGARANGAVAELEPNARSPRRAS